MYINELYHHGIKGQRWGIRRFQNPDGTLTEAGLRRYRQYYPGDYKKLGMSREEFRKFRSDNYNALRSRIGSDIADKAEERMIDVLGKIYFNDYESYKGKYKNEYDRIVNQGKQFEKLVQDKYGELKQKELKSITDIGRVKAFFFKS